MGASTYASCLYARLFVRGIYNVLATYMREYSALPTFSQRFGAPTKRAKLDKPAFKELQFWANVERADVSVSLIAPKAVKTLWTDASELRWGAVLDDTTVSGEFPEHI